MSLDIQMTTDLKDRCYEITRYCNNHNFAVFFKRYQFEAEKDGEKTYDWLTNFGPILKNLEQSKYTKLSQWTNDMEEIWKKSFDEYPENNVIRSATDFLYDAYLRKVEKLKYTLEENWILKIRAQINLLSKTLEE